MPTEPIGARVELEAVAFEPARLQIPTGTTVTWINLDQFEHTVTGGTPRHGTSGFDSRRLAGGDEVARTFDQPGTFPYYCRIHPENMTGRVRVQPSAPADMTEGRTP